MNDGAGVVSGGIVGGGSGSVGGGRGGEKIHHYLAADEGFEGKSGEHVQPKAEAGDVDEGGGGEVVEYVAIGEGAEGEEAGEGHGEAGEEGDYGADVGEEGEAGEGGRGKGGVDEEGVVVADEGCGVLDWLLGGGKGEGTGEGGQTEGYDADGLENADVDSPEW